MRVCALCRREIAVAEVAIYSPHTGNTYCGPVNEDRCRQLQEKEKASLAKEKQTQLSEQTSSAPKPSSSALKNSQVTLDSTPSAEATEQPKKPSGGRSTSFGKRLSRSLRRSARTSP